MLNKIYFDNFVRLNRGFDLPDNRMQEGEFPVVASTNIKGYHNEYKIEPPVVVTGRSGSLGNVQYITDKCWPLNTTLYSKDFRGNNPHYIYYYLQTMHLEQYNAGAGVPTLNQNHLQRLKVLVHPIDEQDKIAFILSTYDSLIEANNKRIKLLERMAEELYKEWFVRFRFPGYETAEFENGIPKGWEITRADDVIEFNPTIKAENQMEFRIIPMESLSTNSMLLDESKFEVESGIKGRRSQNGDTLLAKITPCLENGKTGFVARLEDGEVAGGSTEFIVMRSKKLSSYYVYLLARSQYFRQTAILSMNGADGRQRVDEGKIKAMKLPVPPMCTVELFDSFVKPLFDEILHLSKVNQNLIKQRDLLLPRLMSGKLEV